MGISLDDLKNLWFGVTNPQHWQNAANQLGAVGPAIANFKSSMSDKLGLNSGGASPISAAPPSLGEVWQKLNSMLPSSGATQPANNSGSSR